MRADDIGSAGKERFLAASEWFARMRGPGAQAAHAEFKDWHSDPANRQAYAEMEAIWTASASARPGAASVRQHRLRPGLVAAGIAAAVTLGLLVHGHIDRAPSGSSRLYGSERGAIREVELADGSRVILDTASQVRTVFDQRTRNVVLLAGRARFQVKHDTAHPFVVNAAGHAIVARGTVFDVRVEDGGTQVVLIEGAVDLQHRDRAGVARIVGRLRPGETAIFVGADSSPRILRSQAQSWTSGVISAQGMRLSDLLREASRYSARPIRLADASLGELKITGAFRPSDSEQLAQALASALSLRVAHGPGDVLTLVRTPETSGRASCEVADCLAP